MTAAGTRQAGGQWAGVAVARFLGCWLTASAEIQRQDEELAVCRNRWRAAFCWRWASRVGRGGAAGAAQ